MRSFSCGRLEQPGRCKNKDDQRTRASGPAAPSPESHSIMAGSLKSASPKKAAKGLSTPKECSTMSEVQTATAAHTHDAPLIGVLMGSSSDWDVMKNAVAILQEFGVPYEAKVVSAHRMPDEMFAYAESARKRGLAAIIAGAGGAAHLASMPGSCAAKPAVR